MHEKKTHGVCFHLAKQKTLLTNFQNITGYTGAHMNSEFENNKSEYGSNKSETAN